MRANGPSNEVQIRRLVNDWAKAVRARDMDGATFSISHASWTMFGKNRRQWQ